MLKFRMGNKVYLFIIFSLLAGQLVSQETEGSERPNIIFIMADDLGWGELNSYGNDFNETPNLNKLAAQGMLFSNAYAAAPVCSPTRASVVTGQYPARVGITDFLAPSSNEYLKPDEHITINEALSEVGYHTGIIGKWHLETHFNNIQGGPEDHGFDEVIGSETKYIADGDYFFPYDKSATLNDKGEEGEFLTDRLVQEAKDFIGRNKEKPFFLYLSHYSVHTTLAAPEDLVTKYKKKFNEKYGEGKAEKLFDGQKRGRHRANHIDNPYLAAMLERIDAGVGEIMAKLESEGLAENTVLVFFSDNGGAHNSGNNSYLKGYKTQLYEGGIREPLIIRWPGKIKPGAVTHEPVSSIDFYPTFLDIAQGINTEQHLDGVSLMPLLKENKSCGERTLYWHYPSETGNAKHKMSSAIRVDDYKLIEFYEDCRKELYNLKADPGETTDLSEDMPEMTSSLYQKLQEWKKEVNALAPKI